MDASPLIRVIAPNAVRITHFDPSLGQPTDRPWLKDVLLDLSITEKRGIAITVDVQNGQVCAQNSHGEPFFRESAPPLLGIHKRRPYSYFDVPQTGRYHYTIEVLEPIAIAPFMDQEPALAARTLTKLIQDLIVNNPANEVSHGFS